MLERTVSFMRKIIQACFPVHLVLNQFTLAKFPGILTFQIDIDTDLRCSGSEPALALNGSVTWPFVGSDASSIGSGDVKVLNILSHVRVMESQARGSF